MQEKLTTSTNVERPSWLRQRPSWVRHIVLAAFCLLYLIAYVDRTVISTTGPKISKEFGFTSTQMGIIYSAFSFTYALLPIIVGTFGDRLGPRRVLSLAMAWWSFFTVLTGVVSSFFSFVAMRLLIGLGESGSFPVATRALASWYPPSARAFLQGVTHAASRIGAAISIPIIVALVIIFGGWRWSFYILGSVGIVWSILFYIFFRDKPSEVAAVNEAEMAVINQGRAARVEPLKANPPVPWRKLLASKDIWILCVIQFIYGYTFWIYLTWLPTYLTNSRHFSFEQLGIVASLPLFGGVLGDLVGGWVSDAIYKKTGKLNLARRSMILIAFLGAAAFTIPALLVSNALVAELLMVGTMFMLECSVSSTWAVAMDIGGEHYSGTTSGFVSTSFGIAGIVAPSLFGILRDQTGSFTPGFFSGSVLLVIGAFVVFLLNANNLLVPRETASAEAEKVDEIDAEPITLTEFTESDQLDKAEVGDKINTEAAQAEVTEETNVSGEAVPAEATEKADTPEVTQVDVTDGADTVDAVQVEQSDSSEATTQADTAYQTEAAALSDQVELPAQTATVDQINEVDQIEVEAEKADAVSQAEETTTSKEAEESVLSEKADQPAQTGETEVAEVVDQAEEVKQVEKADQPAQAEIVDAVETANGTGEANGTSAAKKPVRAKRTSRKKTTH